MKSSNRKISLIEPKISHLLFTTESQKEIWHSCHFGGDDANCAYNESISLELYGSVNVSVLSWSFKKLVERHESLRSVFSPDGKLICVFSELEIDVKYLDYSSLNELVIQEKIDEIQKVEATTPFNLTKGPLIRPVIIKRGENIYHFLITVHHIVCDGWSQGMILEELGILYSSKLKNEEPVLPKAFQYTEYAINENGIKGSDSFKNSNEFWTELFKDSVPETDLSFKSSKNLHRTFKSNTFYQSFDLTLMERIKALAVKGNSSLVLTLMSAFELLLSRYSGQRELTLGLPVARQPAMGTPNLIGHCVNLLPFKTEIDVNKNFIEYLKQRKSFSFDAFEHQELSFGQILKNIKIQRRPGRVPLVPVVFNIDTDMNKGVHFEGLTHKLGPNKREYENFELFLNLTGTKDKVSLEWSYNCDLLEDSLIIEMADSFEELLNKLAISPELKLSEVILRPSTNFKIEGKDLDYPKRPLHELFYEAAEKQKDAIAVQDGEVKVSYEALMKKAKNIGFLLRQKGLTAGGVVAISLDRSPELIAVIFAVLECGASYVPIDTAYPDARKRLMVSDSASELYISESSIDGLEDFTKMVLLDDLLGEVQFNGEVVSPSNVSNNAPAYVIYTSGSTGKPKGVQVTHRNVVNLLFSMRDEPGISSEDKIFATTTISFDAMVMEIFLPLVHGASIVIVDETTRKDGYLLLEKAVQDEITMMWGTPTIWQILLDSGWKEPLKIKALIGGEPVPRTLALELLKKCDEVWNIYGPTETTVCCLTTRISEHDNPITVGKPVANTQIYLLDKNLNPVPDGMEGEIVIGGDGVSLGYLGNEVLSNKRFVENPINGDLGKVYLSGDLGRLLPNGQIQCLGRRDGQVKVRGHRIELGEIETVLKKLTEIESLAVTVENQALNAYLVNTENTDVWNAKKNLWQNQLSQELPSYMLPKDLVQIDSLPTTVNGKLDRVRLKGSSSSTNTNSEIGVDKDMFSVAEKLVAEIWKDSLGLQSISPQSDFFQIGGHSLVAAQVMTRIEERTGQRLPMASLFEHSTVEKFASLLDLNKKSSGWDSLVPIKPTGNKPPIFIVHGAGLNVLLFKNLEPHIHIEQPIYGLQPKGLNGVEKLLESVEEIAEHYINSIRKVQPKGPYNLSGYSSGGIIAFEMLRQLKDQGEEVSTLALFDTYAFYHYGYNSYFGKKIAYARFLAGKTLFVLKEALSSKEGLKYRIRVTKRNLKLKLLKIKKDNQELSSMGIDSNLEELVQKHDAVVNKYHLRPMNLIVDLFKVQEVVEYTHDSLTLGWKRFAKGGVRIHKVPGNHLSMFSEPNVKSLAIKLQELLDERKVKTEAN